MTPPTPNRGLSRRSERGHLDRSFMRTVAMVCLISLLLSGLTVYWIEQTPAPSRAGDQDAAHPPQRADHAHPATLAGQRPTPSQTGADGCG
jgi:hypothetical protein